MCPPPPQLPEDGASAAELGECLADLISWLVKARLADLLDAGLTHHDVFRLVKAAHDYRTDQVDGETRKTLRELTPLLDGVDVFKVNRGIPD